MDQYETTPLPTTPTEFMSTVKFHAREYSDLFQKDDVKIIELCMDVGSFRDNAKGWVEVDSNRYGDLSKHSLLAMELFGYIASEMMNDTISCVIPTFEIKPHRNDGRNAAMCLRILIGPSSAQCAGGVISKLIQSNIEEMNKARNKAQEKKGASYQRAFKRMTIEDYKAMCNWYFPPADEDREQYPDIMAFNEILVNPSHPYHPYQIFSLSNSLKRAERFKAQSEFCDIQAYSQGLFADMKLVHRLEPIELCPMRLFHRYLPHIPRSDFINDEMKYSYIISQLDEEDRTDPRKVGACIQRLEASVCRSSAGRRDLTMVDAKKKIQALMNRAKLESQNAVHDDGTPYDEAEKILEWERRRELALKEAWPIFNSVVNEEGMIGDAPKECLRWIKTYLATHNNMCMPQRRRTDNLSRLAEFWTGLSASLESIQGVATFFTEIVAGLCALQHLYLGRKFNVNTLMLGPPKLGKTKALAYIQHFMIPKTFISVSYTTPKAFAAPGFQNDQKVIFFEETPPSALGVIQNGIVNKSGDDSSTNNSDGEATWKNILTEGAMNFIAKGIVNGQHKSFNYEVTCRLLAFKASNVNAHSIPYSLACRYHIVVCQHNERRDGGDIATKNQRNINEEVRSVDQALVLRLQRNQAMACVLGALIEAGMLPDIDLYAAEVVIHAVIQRAQQKNLNNLDCYRSYQRCIGIVEGLVMTNVILQLFDDINSPLAHKPFAFEDLLLARKHLKSTVEHAAMALGLLEDQFENNVSFNVIQHFEHVFQSVLPNEIRMRKKLIPPIGLKRPQPDADGGRKKNKKQKQQHQNDDGCIQTVLAPITSSSSSSSSSSSVPDYVPYENNDLPSNKRVNGPTGAVSYNDKTGYYECSVRDPPYVLDNNYRFNQFKGYIYPAMKHPKPSFQDFAHAVSQLRELRVTDGQDKGTLIPALDFKSNAYMVAASLIHQNQDRVLFKCLMHVLCHPFARKQRILYLRADKERPYTWMSAWITPRSRTKRNKQQQQQQQGVLNLDDDDEYDDEFPEIEEVDEKVQQVTPASTPTKHNPRHRQQHHVRYTNTLIRVDPDYFSDELQQWTEVLVEGVDTPKIDFSKVYSNLPCCVLDMDLDECATEEFNNKNGIFDAHGKSYPSNDPDVLLKQEVVLHKKLIRDVEARQGETAAAKYKLIHYPNFSTIVDATKTHRMRLHELIKTDAAKYSVRNQLHERKKRMEACLAKHPGILDRRQRVSSSGSSSSNSSSSMDNHSSSSRGHMMPRPPLRTFSLTAQQDPGSEQDNTDDDNEDEQDIDDDDDSSDENDSDAEGSGLSLDALDLTAQSIIRKLGRNLKV